MPALHRMVQLLVNRGLESKANPAGGELFRAEALEQDPAKRDQLHRQILDFIRARQSDKDSWSVAVASVAQFAGDPAAG